MELWVGVSTIATFSSPLHSQLSKGIQMNIRMILIFSDLVQHIFSRNRFFLVFLSAGSFLLISSVSKFFLSLFKSYRPFSLFPFCCSSPESFFFISSPENFRIRPPHYRAQ
jgi:hypothetical protein